MKASLTKNTEYSNSIYRFCYQGALADSLAAFALHKALALNSSGVLLSYRIFFFILLAPIQAVGASFTSEFVEAAIERTNQSVRYDGSYISIDYPNGDVPANIGVCTDVVIRSYRKIGTDLQVLVHEDMASSFDAYPSKKDLGIIAAR